MYVDTIPTKDDETLRAEAAALESVYMNQATAKCAKLAAGSLVVRLFIAHRSVLLSVMCVFSDTTGYDGSSPPPSHSF